MTDGMCTIWTEGQADVTGRQDQRSDLIKRACTDPNAFAELCLQHYEDVFRYCNGRLFDRHLAEDVTSTVFFKVMRSLSSFDGDASAFRSWLLRIAANAANDHLRQARRRLAVTQNIVDNTQAENAHGVGANHDLIEKRALLKRSLLSLKPKYQTVIALRFFENMKLTEIGACLGEKPSTIRTRLSRATARLRQVLNAHGENMR